MSKPIILTAADEKFTELIRPWRKQVKKFKYEPLILDLGGLGVGPPYSNDQPIVTRYDDTQPETAVVQVGKAMQYRKTNRKALGNFKPQCLLDMMNETGNWDYMMWLDADAFIVQNIDELFEEMADVCVTIRHAPSAKRSSRFLNSGVVVVRDTYNARLFVEQWAAEQRKPECQHDQSALHNVFYNWHHPLEPSFANRTHLINGVLVRCLPWKVYNSTFSSVEKFNEIREEGTAKIWHMQKGYFPQTKECRELLFEELKKT